MNIDSYNKRRCSLWEIKAQRTRKRRRKKLIRKKLLQTLPYHQYNLNDIKRDCLGGCVFCLRTHMYLNATVDCVITSKRGFNGGTYDKFRQILSIWKDMETYKYNETHRSIYWQDGKIRMLINSINGYMNFKFRNSWDLKIIKAFGKDRYIIIKEMLEQK